MGGVLSGKPSVSQNGVEEVFLSGAGTVGGTVPLASLVVTAASFERRRRRIPLSRL